MPDKQIHPGGVVPAPADYPIPAAAEVALKMAFARFDGSAAAGSWKPCLRIISDAGTVAGEAVGDDTVAAGGSADVTWFPHIGGGGGSSTTNAEWFLVRRTTSQTMAGGSSDTVRWTDLHSSDPTLFSLATDNHPNDAVQVSRLGVVVLLAWILPSVLDPNYTLELILTSPGQGVASGTTYPDVQLGTQAGLARNPQGPQGMTLMVPDAIPFQLVTFYWNHDVANRNIAQAQMWGFWWPTGAPNPF